MDNTKYVQLIGRCELRKVLFCASKDMDGAKHEGECERAITALLARCDRLEEARENANEACAKWEGMYHMAMERAEKAERERDAAISDLTYIARTYPVDLCDDLVCQYCKHYQNVNTGCPGWTENDCFEWRGKKEE